MLVAAHGDLSMSIKGPCELTLAVTTCWMLVVAAPDCASAARLSKEAEVAAALLLTDSTHVVVDAAPSPHGLVGLSLCPGTEFACYYFFVQATSDKGAELGERV
eukprot:1580827-Pyramimonas_sp.AAC.2